jgi:MFS family permease
VERIGRDRDAAAAFLGGWLIGSVSWRAIFFINLPIVARRGRVDPAHVSESFDSDADQSTDFAAHVALGLGAWCTRFIEGPAKGWEPMQPRWVLGDPARELHRHRDAFAHPMVPLSVFRSRQFSGTNL